MFIKWDAIPDLGLYMDQTVSFVQEQMSGWMRQENSDALTPSMINNYAKKGLIPRPEKRKYYRAHIALLLVIAFLKNTMSMDEIAAVFRTFENDAQCIYKVFSQEEKDDRDAVRGTQEKEALLRFAVRVNRMQLSLRDAVSALPKEETEKEEKEKPKGEKKSKKKTDQK